MKIPKIGDLLIITTKKSDGKRIACTVKDIVCGNEVILQKSTNSFFNFDMFLEGKSWVSSIENIGRVEMTTASNNVTHKNFTEY